MPNSGTNNRLNEDSTDIADPSRARGVAVQGVPEVQKSSDSVDLATLHNQPAKSGQCGTDAAPQSLDDSDWPIWKLLHGTENFAPVPDSGNTSSSVRNAPATLMEFSKTGRRIISRSRGRILALAGDERIFQKAAMLVAVSAMLVLLVAATVQRFSTSANTLVRSKSEEIRSSPLQRKVSLSEASRAESDLGFNFAGAISAVNAHSNMRKSLRNGRTSSIAKDTVTTYQPVSATAPGDQTRQAPVSVPLDLKSN